MKDYLDNCPVCSGKLNITRYTCDNCYTEINGEFSQTKFARLSQKDLEFIEAFVMNRGSIKEMEKTLGISYPTVRARLDEVVKALGHQVDPDKSRIEILNMVNDGLLSTEEALKLLEELGE